MKAAESVPPNFIERFLQEFLGDVADCWRRLPDKALLLVLLAAWLALFHFLGNSTLGYFKSPSLFRWLIFVATSMDNSDYIQVVPFAVLALFWWKRRTLLDGTKAVWWPALGLVVLGLVSHLAGFVFQLTQLSVAGFFVGLYGLTGLVWGRQWLRDSRFPFFIFIFCVPLSNVAEPLTFHLRMLVAQIVTGVGHVLGIDVIRDGSQLFNAQRTFGYDVAPACSGIRSLISLLALTTIYGFVVFRSSGKRLLMAVMALPLAVLGNVLRISFVIVTAEALGQDAGTWVENKLGYLTFIVAIVCVLLLGHWLREPEAGREPNTGNAPA